MSIKEKAKSAIPSVYDLLFFGTAGGAGGLIMGDLGLAVSITATGGAKIIDGLTLQRDFYNRQTNPLYHTLDRFLLTDVPNGIRKIRGTIFDE